MLRQERIRGTHHMLRDNRKTIWVEQWFPIQMIIWKSLQGRREKRKYEYHVRKNLDFDKAELMLYEAVEKMPPFSRKTLVLVSPQGLPKQSLIHKLVDSNPDMYGTTVPCKNELFRIFILWMEGGRLTLTWRRTRCNKVDYRELWVVRSLRSQGGLCSPFRYFPWNRLGVLPIRRRTPSELAGSCSHILH